MDETKRKVIGCLAELFEMQEEELKDNFELTENIWDSLAIVTTISLVHKYYKIVLDGDKVEKCSKLSDLFDLIKDELTK